MRAFARVKTGLGEVVTQSPSCLYSLTENQKAVTTTIHWSLNGFTTLAKNNILSPPFVIRCADDRTNVSSWCLLLCLGKQLANEGDEAQLNADHVAIGLRAACFDDNNGDRQLIEQQVHMKIALGNGAHTMSNYHLSPKKFDSDTSCLFWPNFVERDALMTNYVKDNKLVIVTTITVYHCHREDYQRLSRMMLTLSQQQLGDFAIRCQGKETKVPKALLVESSPVLARMLQTDMKEANEGVLAIDDTDHQTIESLVKFLYIGELLADMDAVNLLLAADKYDIGRLKQLCVRRLLSELTVDNCCQLLALGDLTNATELKKAAMALISTDETTVKSSQGSKDDYLEKSDRLMAEVMAELEKAKRKVELEPTGGRKRKHQE